MVAAGIAADLQGVQPAKQKRVRSATASIVRTCCSGCTGSQRLLLQAILQNLSFRISELRWRARGSSARSAASAARGQARNTTATSDIWPCLAWYRCAHVSSLQERSGSQSLSACNWHSTWASPYLSFYLGTPNPTQTRRGGECCAAGARMRYVVADLLAGPLLHTSHLSAHGLNEGGESLSCHLTDELRLYVQRCIFLDSEDLCSIHTQRPRQCSTYPWWPDLMESAAWDTEAERICEGMNHAEAEPCDVEDAAEQLRLATNHVNSRRAS